MMKTTDDRLLSFVFPLTRNLTTFYIKTLYTEFLRILIIALAKNFSKLISYLSIIETKFMI